ncbi:MAG: S-adenosylmethionine:tRNA ribosyltransferase-isomerase [Bacteroidetes bacterium]|nr:S-adenosylmethionine:tRNA ribosyltransferase-isomerase [Bacteroidota bacterium]
MTHPSQIRIEHYTYQLPDERIAKYPLAERDQSKLLVYQQGGISEDVYINLANYLPEGALLVYNNTKVVHARIFFETHTGAKVEIFCLEPYGEHKEMASAMSAKGSAKWKCMVGRASKWKDKVLTKQIGDITLTAELVERIPDAFVVQFAWQPQQLSFAEVIDKAGVMPIPPYLKRTADDTDAERYQTVFAKYEGSVAAPTSGLHFTQRVFDKLYAKHIHTDEVTLHVGAGTFKPVKSETMEGHEMHQELIDVTANTLQNLIANVGNIVAVGTTSLRTIESLYWMGVKALLNPDVTIEDIEVKQWDAYELSVADTKDALSALLHWMQDRELEHIICKTQIIIAPPYQLKVAKALATNFHQPNSTLLLLVAAVVGDKWKDIYAYAMGNNFRFLSYGDGSLLFAE